MAVMGALLPAENMLLDADLPGPAGLFHAVGALFERRYGLPADKVAASLDARERIGSTGLGQGVAIPHARIKGLAQAVAAFVRTRVPIDFGAPDDKPVSDFLVLLVPVARDRRAPADPRRRGDAVRRPGTFARSCAPAPTPRRRARCSPTGCRPDGAARMAAAPLSSPQKARILAEALPFIRGYHGKTLIIRFGGGAMADPALKDGFARDVALLRLVGMNPIVVHGGGWRIDELLRADGHRAAASTAASA